MVELTGGKGAVGEEGEEGVINPALEAQRQALEKELEAYRASFFAVAEK